MLKRLKMGQGQPRVTIYINFVDLEYKITHAKFHDHMTISSVGEDFEDFTIYDHNSHFDHVT